MSKKYDKRCLPWKTTKPKIGQLGQNMGAIFPPKKEPYIHWASGWTEPNTHADCYPTGYLCGKQMGRSIRTSSKPEEITCPECKDTLSKRSLEKS